MLLLASMLLQATRELTIALFLELMKFMSWRLESGCFSTLRDTIVLFPFKNFIKVLEQSSSTQPSIEHIIKPHI